MIDSVIILLVLSAIASIVVGSISNWVYELLKNAGIFPNKPTLKAVAIVAFASLPFILLIILKDIPDEDKAFLLELAQTSVPAWLSLAIMVSTFLIGYLVGHRHVNYLQKNLLELKNKLTDTEMRLENSEKRLDDCIKIGRQRPKDVIIKPK